MRQIDPIGKNAARDAGETGEAMDGADEGAGLALDLESRAQDGDHQALRVWLRLLACTTRVEDQIRQRLRNEFGTTLPRFDLLAQLERSPEGLTMRELSQRLMVTGGNVTGIADQLESEGLVVREPHPSDRRSVTVRLTPAGRRSFKRMAATHEGWILELLGGWSPEQMTQVMGLLAGLKGHLATLETSRK
ncbi:MarR family winged helix-turn-helix transcriptional regulator [Roseateles chitosanitabidus]|jgi:DNA-binding MarR family transcriptional regulator|uniref:MarR family winged helix-turn-helix transcriptional regulator n=1 Tax=Roseateles chitosanitabidus TaxID=65048 RepID=UPI000AB75BCC|nr:MarR family transcriptional regulator [Roseateles chitosanitabidus]